MADVQKTAAAIVAAPTDVVVTAIATLQAALHAAKALLDTGATDVDALLETVKTELPGLEKPLLDLLHLTIEKKA